MKPRVTKRERRLHLSYDLPHRIHTTAIYPISAPNGSTVIVYGHDHGLRILWRGGRRRRLYASTPAVKSRSNGTSKEEPILLVDDDEEPEEQTLENNDFEHDEEELDPDCPYSSIIQDLDISMGPDVLHLAYPALHTSHLTPAVFRRAAVVAVSSADGAIRLLQLPLLPPSEDDKEQVVQEIVNSQVELSANGPISSNLSLKYIPSVDNHLSIAPRAQQAADGVQGRLLIAAASRTLSIWEVPVTADAILNERPSLLRNSSLQHAANRLVFQPTTKSSHLLLADLYGAVRLYEPYQKSSLGATGATQEVDATTNKNESGRWLIAYHAPFNTDKPRDPSPVFARRKKILDVKWVLGGSGILALLEDGQWGVWDITGSAKPDEPVDSFAVQGFLDHSRPTETVEPTKPRKGIAKLAPMTPNTRKTKAEELFKGASRVPGVISQGGISVSVNNTRAGQADESVVLWYNSNIYSIPSMQAFWSRSISNTGGIGSLHSPGLAHITDVELVNENITHIAQFNSKLTAPATGQMNTQRDLLISAEHRAIILQTLRPSTPARSLFQLVERPASRDVQMTDVGDHALDEINAMLDNMTDRGNTVARKVGFVQ